MRSLVAQALPSLFVAVAVLVGWELAVEIFNVSEFVLAKPTEILAELSASSELLRDAAGYTLQEIVYGFALSAAVGIAIALVLAAWRLADRALYPLVVAFQTVPKVALAPIFVLWFGYGVFPKMLLIATIAFFPVALNMRTGLYAVDRDLLLLLQSVGASRWEILRKVQIPNALPYLFAGLKIAITFSVIGAVVAEFAGSSQGLGYLIEFASTQLDTRLVFAALLVISILGLALYYGVGLLERLVSRRYPPPQGLNPVG
ncbi:MAG: ABC transporter permease subunit [Solirubrobacterales bacterium]|nr:ABC transporter permease subunit [Solirubrobacterales bacterium]